MTAQAVTSTEPEGKATPKRRSRRRLWWLGLLTFLLVGLGLAVWGALETRKVVAAAHDAQAAQADLEQSVESRDWVGAQEAGNRLRLATHKASAAAHALPLDVATLLPMVGDDVEAVQVLTGGLDRISREALIPLLQSLEAAVNLSTSDGAIDVSLLADLGSVLGPADETIADVAADVAEVDTRALLGPLRKPVEDVRDGLAGLADQSHDVARLLEQLPGFLGADGPRNYLLLLQNPAEARPTGGIVGLVALVRAEAGQVTMTDVVTHEELGTLALRDLDVVPDAMGLYGEQLRRAVNFTMSPDFPVAAQLLIEAWERSWQLRPDGVIAVDPVALHEVLAVTGPLDLAGGPQLSADNVAEVLMHSLYDLLGGSSPVRDAFLEEVIRQVFIRATTQGTQLWKVGEALTTPEMRGHVLAWSSREEEQHYFRDLGYAGEQGDASNGRLGVYVTNADASKLDYFLDATIRTTCASTGSTTSLTLTNSAPAEVSSYVGSKLTRPNTVHRVAVSWYVPGGQGIRGVAVDGISSPFVIGNDGSWLVPRLEVDVPAGGVVRVDLNLSSSTPVSEVVTQPFVRDAEIELVGCR